jgi:AcrR family transcriptional regulator
MPRIVKEEVYAQRRGQIIAAAQQLVFVKGYEQMSIQDVIDLAGISKGAFYHYFHSKSDLLEALIDSLVQESERVITPLLDDPHLSALEKLSRFFTVLARWKTDRKQYLIALLRIWYNDDNAIVRDKVTVKQLDVAAHWLGRIFRQGMIEGTLDIPFPDQMAQAALILMSGLSITFARLMFTPPTDGDVLQLAYDTTRAYNLALERLLGVPPGSVPVLDEASVREWIEIEA